MGRVTLQRDYDTNGTTVLYSRSATYSNKGQVSSDSSSTLRSGVTYTANSTYDYGVIGTNAGNSTYALGSPLSITTVNFENSVQKKTNKTVNTYDWREGATLNKVEYYADFIGAPTVKNTSTYTYDVIGGKAQLKWVNIADGRPREVVFMYDQMGQVIKRDEKDALSGGDPHEVWYRFSGRQIGYVGNNGTIDTTYAQSIANRTAAQGNGAFFNGSSSSTSSADFDLASDNLNSYAQGSSAGMYVVQQGDTLSSIASNLWGDSTLWYKLAEINGRTAESELPEGLPLIIPSGVIRDTNTASTFKPYDPNEVMGNLSPTAVAPPKKGNNCGIIGSIILVVIAAVVTYFTWGQRLNFLSALSANSVAPSLPAPSRALQVLSSAKAWASQPASQEKFSWNAVALAALTVGVTKGLTAATMLSPVASAVAANAITQGIGVATGLQDNFSWAGVAAAGVGAAAGGYVNAQFGTALNGALGVDLARGVISGASALANAATRTLIDGSDFGDNVLAALPDVIGQTIGEAIAGSMTGRGASTTAAPNTSKTPQPSLAEALAPIPELDAMLAWSQEAGDWVDGILNGGGSQTHSVSRGDTVEAIARATYGDNWRAGVAAIIGANDLHANANGSPLIHAGSDIILPSLSGQDTAALGRAGGTIIANNSRGLAAAQQAEAALSPRIVADVQRGASGAPSRAPLGACAPAARQSDVRVVTHPSQEIDWSGALADATTFVSSLFNGRVSAYSQVEVHAAAQLGGLGVSELGSVGIVYDNNGQAVFLKRTL